jgi:membrane fusion protein, heavy metal efflux system
MIPLVRIPVLVLLALGMVACGARTADEGHAEQPSGGHGHSGEGEELERGPHGGRLLESGAVQAELLIFEKGVPPEFRLYMTANGRPVDPEEVEASIELRRVTGLPGGLMEQVAFTPRGEYLVGDREIHEPHSFDLTLRVSISGEPHEWTWESPEGRIELTPEIATASGVAAAVAGPGVIAEELRLFGRLVPDAERVRSVRARFPGTVRTVAVRPGDTVRQGQVMATVESNESLQAYSVTAPIGGIVTARNANPGESAGDAPLFEVVDYDSVWAELAVFPRDRARLAVGQKVIVTAADSAQQGTGTIRMLTPAAAGQASLTARVVLDNRDRRWSPGQFVEGQVAVAEHPAPIVVPVGALQRFREWDVVFVNDGEFFQAQPVELGRRDAMHAEVRSGLAAGARVVTGNSYLIKADIEKAGASHDH